MLEMVMQKEAESTENISWIPASAGMTEKEGSAIPRRCAKTGMAMILRDWMKSRTGTKAQRRFTTGQICEELCVTTGDQHQEVARALGDFIRRGELIAYYNKKHNRRQLIYNFNWRKAKKGTNNQKIFKAMYVSQSFAATDIQRLVGMKDRSWLDKTIRNLIKEGHLQQIQRRLCAHGAGAEAVYHIGNRDKFKLEKMK